MSFGFGTEFVSMLYPPAHALDNYDHTKRHNEQPDSIPSVFCEAMAVREEVFVDEQGIPLENEVDEDDRRSWHWVVCASVASTSPPPSAVVTPAGEKNGHHTGKKAELNRRSSATTTRLPVGTIRLIPPPHRPNPYKTQPDGDKHPDADPPAEVKPKHPLEPYIKLGRLATLSDYRGLGLSRLLINTALEWAAKNPTSIWTPPSPTTMEMAKVAGIEEQVSSWNGLCMVHAQMSVKKLWAKQGFTEELLNDEGKVEIPKEEHWFEEGIEHLAMWKRLKVENPRL